MVNTLTDSPVASRTLAADQPRMEQNNIYYAHTLIVDHQIGDATAALTTGNNDGIAKEGYHKVIHYVNQGADPATIAGVGELYTKTTGTPADQQLYYKSGGGTVQQLTNNSGIILRAAGNYSINSGTGVVTTNSSFNLTMTTPMQPINGAIFTFVNALPNANYYISFSHRPNSSNLTFGNIFFNVAPTNTSFVLTFYDLLSNSTRPILIDVMVFQ